LRRKYSKRTLIGLRVLPTIFFRVRTSVEGVCARKKDYEPHNRERQALVKTLKLNNTSYARILLTYDILKKFRTPIFIQPTTGASYHVKRRCFLGTYIQLCSKTVRTRAIKIISPTRKTATTIKLASEMTKQMLNGHFACSDN